MGYINLVGSDDVYRASHNMQAAASEISQAALNLSDSLAQHQRFMDDWLYRLEEIMKGDDNE